MCLASWSLDLIRGRWVREFGCEVVGAQALRFSGCTLRPSGQAGVPVPLRRDTICGPGRYFIGWLVERVRDEADSSYICCGDFDGWGWVWNWVRAWRAAERSRRSRNRLRRLGLIAIFRLITLLLLTGALPDTLDPKQFSDARTQKIYAMAAKVKPVLYQQPCYCRCDREVGHTSLLDCFRDNHGSICDVCKKEAAYSYQQTKLGKTSC